MYQVLLIITEMVIVGETEIETEIEAKRMMTVDGVAFMGHLERGRRMGEKEIKRMSGTRGLDTTTEKK